MKGKKLNETARLICHCQLFFHLSGLVYIKTEESRDVVRYGIPAEVGSGQGSGGASSCGGSGQSTSNKPSQKQVPTVIHIEHVDKLSETPAQLMNRLVITKYSLHWVLRPASVRGVEVSKHRVVA